MIKVAGTATVSVAPGVASLMPRTDCHLLTKTGELLSGLIIFWVCLTAGVQLKAALQLVLPGNVLGGSGDGDVGLCRAPRAATWPQAAASRYRSSTDHGGEKMSLILWSCSTVVCFFGARWIFLKTHQPLLHPVLWGTVSMVVMIELSGHSYLAYKAETEWLVWFLGPAVVALGCTSHGVGTARALELGETQGAFASIGMACSAMAASIICPMLLRAL